MKYLLTQEQINTIIPNEDSEEISIIEKLVKESLQHCDAYDEWLEIFIDNPIPERLYQAPYEIIVSLLELFPKPILSDAITNNWRVITTLNQCFEPKNLECDGAVCLGCWKDIVRACIKMLESPSVSLSDISISAEEHLKNVVRQSDCRDEGQTKESLWKNNVYLYMDSFANLKIKEISHQLLKKGGSHDEAYQDGLVDGIVYIEQLEGIVCFLAGCYEKAKETYFDTHMKVCSNSNPERRELTECEQKEWQKFPIIQGTRIKTIVSEISKLNIPPPDNIEDFFTKFKSIRKQN